MPSPTYPLYTAVLAKIGATPRYYRTDPDRDWMPDLDHLRSLVTDKTRVLLWTDTPEAYVAGIAAAGLSDRVRVDCLKRSESPSAEQCAEVAALLAVGKRYEG